MMVAETSSGHCSVVDSAGLASELELGWLWGAREGQRSQGDACIFGLSARVGGSPIDLGSFMLLPACSIVLISFLPLSAKLFLVADKCIYSLSPFGYICCEWGK